jgi:hypothetical protein
MKNLFKAVLLITIISFMSASAIQAQSTEKSATLRHVVLFKFKDSSSPDDVKKVEEAFAALAKNLKLIKDFDWGTNVSPENHSQGLTHCFFVTFNSAEDRDAYLVHPEHKAFGAIAGPHIDKVTVVDYWVK